MNGMEMKAKRSDSPKRETNKKMFEGSQIQCVYLYIKIYPAISVVVFFWETGGSASIQV